MITAATTEFDCVADGVALNGRKKVPVHVILRSKGSYDFTMQTIIIDAAKAAVQIPIALDNAVRQPDCGSGVFYMNVGETITCKALDAHNKDEPVDIEGTLNTKVELLFKIKIKLKPL